MVNPGPIEPRWVLVEGALHDVSEFAHLKPKQRPPAACPLCELSVVLKLGSRKVHHYAHAREAGCPACQPETALHLNTKFHFADQLEKAPEKQLWIEQTCQNCRVERQRLVWVQDWDTVQVEYRLESARPDIALLAQGRVMATLEILVTHAVDERKAAYFAEQEIPWLEIPASPQLYEPPTAWTAAAPLPIRSRDIPYAAWICPECVLKEERERPQREREKRRYEEQLQREIARQQFLSEIVTHAAMMVDIYFAQGKKYRDIFYVKRRVKDGFCLKAWVENRKKTTLHAIVSINNQPVGNRALHQIKAFMDGHLERLRGQGRTVDVVVDWRKWEPGKKFVAQDFDRYPFRYDWDASLQRWIAESERVAIARKEAATELASILAGARQRLQDPNQEEQWTAALKLAEHDDPAAMPLLVERAANKGFRHRYMALRTLAHYPNQPEVEPILREALTDEDERVRAAASYALKARTKSTEKKPAVTQSDSPPSPKAPSQLLTVELVPKTGWFSNVRDHVDQATWNLLRHQVYAQAGNACEVCGGRGPQWPVECHEVWEYDDQNHVQKLIGLVALCPSCHEVKHIGLAGVKGRRDIAIAHLVQVNGWTPRQVNEHLLNAQITWLKRNKHQWSLDLTFLEQFGIRVEPKR